MATVRRSSPSSPRVLRSTVSVRPWTPTACPRRAVGRRGGSARSSGTAPSTTSTRHTPSKSSKPWPSPQGLQGARSSRALRRLVVQTSGSEDCARTPRGRSLPQGEADSQEAQGRVDTSPRPRLGSTAKDPRTGAEAPRWGKPGAPRAQMRFWELSGHPALPRLRTRARRGLHVEGLTRKDGTRKGHLHYACVTRRQRGKEPVPTQGPERPEDIGRGVGSGKGGVTRPGAPETWPRHLPQSREGRETWRRRHGYS